MRFISILVVGLKITRAKRNITTALVNKLLYHFISYYIITRCWLSVEPLRIEFHCNSWTDVACFGTFTGANLCLLFDYCAWFIRGILGKSGADQGFSSRRDANPSRKATIFCHYSRKPYELEKKFGHHVRGGHCAPFKSASVADSRLTGRKYEWCFHLFAKK